MILFSGVSSIVNPFIILVLGELALFKPSLSDEAEFWSLSPLMRRESRSSLLNLTWKLS